MHAPFVMPSTMQYIVLLTSLYFATKDTHLISKKNKNLGKIKKKAF